MKTQLPSLADALRLGSMMNEKAIGIRHASDGRSCALGAIEDAIGITKSAYHCGYTGQSLMDAYPILENLVKHPAVGVEESLICTIAGLNNGYGCGYNFEPWSREDIAAWIDTLGLEAPVVATEKEELVAQ